MSNGKGRRTSLGTGRRTSTSSGPRLSPRKPSGKRLYG